MTTNSNVKKLTNKELRQVFWRSCQLDVSWNYERQQNLGYSYAMTPVVRKLLRDDPEKEKRALQRGLDFMAITPQLSTLLMGINAAMEEENANNPDFDDSTIAAVKTSLMGPLAGIGDSLIAGTLRIIATGIAISFASKGNILGPILFLLIYNVPGFLIRYFSLKLGYKYGASFITNAEKNGFMEKVTYAAGIIGLMAIGGMIASFVYLDLSFITIGSGKFAEPITNYLDMVMPCLVQLSLFGFMYWLLGKKIKTTYILIGTVVFCIAFCWIFGL